MSKKAIFAKNAPLRARKSLYPALFAQRVEGREKRVLGDGFGLKNFGVNLTKLAPGASSALHHRHSQQDEFIYVLSGAPTLRFGGETQILEPGMVVGFPAGGEAHHLINETDEPVEFLAIGDRTPDDRVDYPNDDLVANMTEDGAWRFTRKDGSEY